LESGTWLDCTKDLGKIEIHRWAAKRLFAGDSDRGVFMATYGSSRLGPISTERGFIFGVVTLGTMCFSLLSSFPDAELSRIVLVG
jgi:hypothetical protein